MVKMQTLGEIPSKNVYSREKKVVYQITVSNGEKMCVRNAKDPKCGHMTVRAAWLSELWLWTISIPQKGPLELSVISWGLPILVGSYLTWNENQILGLCWFLPFILHTWSQRLHDSHWPLHNLIPHSSIENSIVRTFTSMILSHVFKFFPICFGGSSNSSKQMLCGCTEKHKEEGIWSACGSCSAKEQTHFWHSTHYC